MKIYEWGIGEKLAVLFHGWESNAGSLGAFVKPLMQLGYKVVAFDAPAHGGSGGKRANLVYFKRAAKFILEKYPHPDLVVGHSLGANSIIMTSYEEKLKFEKVILVAPLNRLMSVFEDMKELLKIPESLFKRFIDNFEKWAGYSFRDFYFHDYGDKSKIENVLIFHDRNDRITKYSHAEAFEENWKEVELYTINNTGHYKILWDSEMIKKSIDYIAS